MVAWVSLLSAPDDSAPYCPCQNDVLFSSIYALLFQIVYTPYPSWRCTLHQPWYTPACINPLFPLKSVQHCEVSAFPIRHFKCFWWQENKHLWKLPCTPNNNLLLTPGWVCQPQADRQTRAQTYTQTNPVNHLHFNLFYSFSASLSLIHTQRHTQRHKANTLTALD